MAKNEKTGKTVAQVAGMVLAGDYDQDKLPAGAVDELDYENLLRVAYALAGSCLTQAPDKKKVTTKTKGKRK